MLRNLAHHPLLPITLTATAALAVLLLSDHPLPQLLWLLPVAFGMLGRARDSRREWEQQAAFEEAERSRAERRAEAVFDSFVDASPLPTELFAIDGKPLRSNKAAERLLGKVPPPGISLFDSRGLKRAGLLEPQLKRVLAGTRVETPPTGYDPTELGLPGKPGSRICFRATVFPLFDSEGNVTRIAVIHQDITEQQETKTRTPEIMPEPVRPPATTTAAPGTDIRDLEFRRRKIEHSLRESEERYRSFIEKALGYAVLRFTEDGHITAVSPSIETFWGISAATIRTDSSAFFAQVHPDDLDRVRETEAAARTTGRYPDEYRFRVTNRTTDTTRWIELRGSVGTVLGKKTYDAIVFDTTHLIEVERALAAKRAILDTITASNVDGVVILDSELKVASWSKAAETATGMSADDATGTSITKLYPDFDKVGFLPVVRHALADRVPGRHEAFYQDGREQYAGWFDLSAYPHESGVLLIIRNVSARKQTELACRLAEMKLDGLLDTPGLIVTIKDPDLRYTLLNYAALKPLGIKKRSAAEGKTDKDLLKATVADLLHSHDRKCLDDEEPVELELALPDAVSHGSAWYRLTKTPLLDKDDKVCGLLTVGHDITKQVFAQQELARRRTWLEKEIAGHKKLLDDARKQLRRWK
jgi:PAS domain S-box-containing protein